MIMLKISRRTEVQINHKDLHNEMVSKTISVLNKISFQEIRHFKKHNTVWLYSKKITLKGIQPKKNLKVTKNHINLVSKLID